MYKRINRKAIRDKKHYRIRKHLSGTAECPRLAVYRSNKNIYAQIIDDTAGRTLVSSSSAEAGFEGNGSNQEAAKKVGLALAEKAVAKGISSVVFDRGGLIYHGRVAALAGGAREGGLKF
jgi:large subunit ribosomal protein L18